MTSLLCFICVVSSPELSRVLIFKFHQSDKREQQQRLLGARARARHSGAIKCAEVGFVCCAAGQCLHFINNTVVWFGFSSSYSISYVVFSLLKCNFLIVKVLFNSCNKYLNSKYNIIKKMISDQIYKTELKLKELRMSILKNFPINKNKFMPKLSTFLSLT